ncbi:diuretic hormone receptor-like isoform X2 [Amphiura filiformis]|uniref:diuretic hormone receptor-like isoform X2 n=1 Tax=Amphiura filiformis TaxID=82378 RepID=UPI003B210F3B
MANTHAIATWTDFSATTVYTDIATVNITTSATVGGCQWVDPNNPVITPDGEIQFYKCAEFSEPGQYLCTNGSYIPLKVCETPVQDALTYILLAETCCSVFVCLIALLIYCIFCRTLIKMKRDESRTHWVHFNLVISFFLRDVVTVITLTTHIDKSCWRNVPVFIPTFSYIMESNFFWMFVEGMYLFVCVTYPYFRIDSKHWLCTKLALFAWGVPGVLVSLWTIVCVQSMKRSSESSQPTNATYSHNITASPDTTSPAPCEPDQAAFSTEQTSAFIFLHTFSFLLLLMNLVMLIKILLTLREKLQGVQGCADQDSKHRRMAKATLFLVVLLGVPNIFPFLINRLVEYIGLEVLFVINMIFVNMNAIQGLMVATLYVLCNTEVRTEVKRQVNRRLAQYNISCLPFRRDNRRRRFGSMAQDTSRRTDCTINCSMSITTKETDGSVGISGDIACERTFEQKQKLLANGGSLLNGNRNDSNESHSMTTIDETEQECLLQGSEQFQPNSSPTNTNNIVSGTYTKLDENPETTL